MLKVMNGATKLILLLLSVLLLSIAFFSLRWHFQHDSAIMLYIVFLMDRFHFIPYRDIFDMNMPGSYFAYYVIGRISEYTNTGIRHVDLAILSTMVLITWMWMKKISWKAAWLGSVLWGLIYLGFGPSMSLQREYIVLLPVILAVFIHTYAEKYNTVLRNAAVGILFGIAATLKPHAVIGLVPLLFFEIINTRREQKNTIAAFKNILNRVVLPVVIGFTVPMLCAFAYLWSIGAIPSFLDIASNYWPLYTHLTGDHETISGLARMKYLIAGYLALGGASLWLLPAGLGFYIAKYASDLTDAQKRQVMLLPGLAFCYSIYPVFAGQFWDYHWLLFLYFIIQLSALCLIDQPKHVSTIRNLIPIVILTIVVITQIPFGTFRYILRTGEFPASRNGRVDEIETFLHENLRPGDTVQPLDWTGGVVQALLLSKAKIATPFVYDFHFYHNISNEYIQSLRRRFIEDLQESRPRFIIQIDDETKTWVSGADTTREFKELHNFIDENYAIVRHRNGYIIYELKAVEIGLQLSGKPYILEAP